MKNALSMQLFRLLLIISILVGGFFILKYTFFYLYPLLIALFISIVLHPTITKIEIKWRIHRGSAVLIMIGTLFLPLLLFVYLFSKYIGAELLRFIDQLPTYMKQITSILEEIEQNYLTPFIEKLSVFIPITIGDPKMIIDSMIKKIDESSTSLFKQIFKLSTDFLSSFTYIVVVIIFIILASYMITKDAPKFSALFYRYFPSRGLQYLHHIRYYAKKSVFGMIQTQLLLAFVSSVISVIGLLFFQSGHALALATVVFFIDLIPYVGVGALFLPWIFYQFFTKGYVLAIQLSLLYMVLIIIRQIIEPRLLATSLGVHPLVALIVLFLGVQLFGITGFFLTPFILISISSLYHAKIIHLLIDYIRDG